MPKDSNLIENGEAKELPKRNISFESVSFWNYQSGTYQGKNCQIANYYDPDGRSVVAQKIRMAGKEFRFLGDTKAAGLYGQWLWRDGGKMIVITEGELDAISLSQVQGHKWPVVSVPNGAQGASKSLKAQLEWLEKFETIVLMFDNDDPGRDAAEECAQLFTPGKCKIAKLPLKDANDMLKAGMAKELINAVWSAKEWRPDGLLSIDDIIDKIEQKVEVGRPWFLPSMTELTYGRRLGEVYGLGAGTGSGKTDLFTQQMAYDMTELGLHVGVIYLEQAPAETGKRLAGKLAGKRFHVPNDGWTQEELRAATGLLRGKATFYDSWGGTDWDVVKAKIRFMAVSLGIQHFYLDHLTALADTSNEKESLEQIMKEMAGLAHELKVIIHFISHLSTPEGKPHEEGGRVMVKHFKGSRAIGFWSFYLFGLERDQQDKSKPSVLRVLKDRYTGQATGEVVYLAYDPITGLLSETTKPEDTHGFKDETDDEL